MGGYSIQREIDILTRAAGSLNHMARRPESMYFDFLREPATQSRQMAIDGSSAAVTFEWIAPVDSYLLRLGGFLIDGSISLTGFMGIAELTNGMESWVVDGDGTVVQDFTDGDRIKQTVDLIALSTGDITSSGAGGTESELIWSITFADMGALLYLPANYRVQMIVRDDLSSITSIESRIMAVKKASIPAVIQ